MSESVAVRENNGTVQAKQYVARVISPPVDVFENADEVLVVADVPGVPSHAVDVRVENGVLTLEAKRPSEPEMAFARSFRFPPGIDAANITAEAKNGTVLVRLPKVAAAKPRKIAVEGA
jgi:HSP20 family protein